MIDSLGFYETIFFERLKQIGEPATANEVVAHGSNDGLRAKTIYARHQDLLRKKLIKLTGYRVCKVSGNKCSTYEVAR